jgi:hypothetical protein
MFWASEAEERSQIVSIEYELDIPTPPVRPDIVKVIQTETSVRRGAQ